MGVPPHVPSPQPHPRRRVWIVDGVQQYELVEVRQLGELILSRISGDQNLNMALYESWVASRVTFPLRSILLQASRNTRSAILLNLLVVAGGFATSGIAVATKSGGKSSALTSWVVFAIGLIVALGGAVSQFFRPAFRATERTALAVELKEAGWDFATTSGDYAGETVDALKVFRTKVSDIHRRAARVAALDTTAQPGARRTASRRTKSTQPPPP